LFPYWIVATAAIFGPWEHGEMTNKLKIPMARTITQKTKGNVKKKVKRHIARKDQIKEKASPSCGRKLFHPHPF
jgi:hypothetical protein